MVPYFLLIGITAATAGVLAIIQDSHKKNQKIIIGIFFGLWILLLALRSVKVGVDLGSYIPWFHSTEKMDFSDIFQEENEWGYWILNKIISIFTDDEQIFLTVIALVTLVPIAYLYAKESENALLSIALLIVMLFPIYFSALRQCIAMAFMVPVYYFTKKRKFWLNVLMILCAWLFHQSALVMLLVYPIYHFKPTQIKMVFVGIAFVLIFLFLEPIFSFLLSIIGGKYEEAYSQTTQTGAYAMLLLFVIFAVYSMLMPRPQAVDKDTAGLRNILFFSVALQAFAMIHSLAMRVNYYFLLLLPILIARLPKLCRKEDKWVADLSVWVMVGFFIAYFFYNAYTDGDILRVFPYIPFWGN